ncbi:3' terminal RNA ribose 2'-O-methyltransferase Hen1 [Gordonia sp. VNQ95]|uniref:3' terminal RNA ribose 2'-O-methyltransferase Hen1 n=1 Tax=Gordonia TaxID=2053 RepID=UPI0032B5C1B9
MTIEARSDDPTTPATDLGFLLHKHPDRVQRFETTQGEATVFYPVADPAVCRAALYLDGTDVMPPRTAEVNRYVNALPYEASSRLVVALGKVFGDALAGRCATRPELVARRWELTVTVAAVPLASALTPADLFGPLGWEVDVYRGQLTPGDLGPSGHARLQLRGRQRVGDALRHLAVLLPVLADDKHYFVDDSEIDKLRRRAGDWLATHPHRLAIARASVKHLPGLADQAAELVGAEVSVECGRTSLARTRRSHVIEVIRRRGARTVLDVGCGEGALLADLADLPGIAELGGVDVSAAALRTAGRRLERWRHVALWQSSLMYSDPRCTGYDVAVLMEVIEHIDLSRLPTATWTMFGDIAPRTVIVTTPNREYNVEYGIPDGQMRHPDHRFEFTRAQFATWCADVAAEYSYAVEIDGIGDGSPEYGSPTQCAVFERVDDRSTEVRS